MSNPQQITLREFLDLRIEALQTYLNTKIEAAETARGIAQATLEKRLEGMNEFRDTLRDQASRFVTRDELGLQLKAILTEVESLKLSRAEMQAKASQGSVYLAILISLCGLALGVLGYIN